MLYPRPLHLLLVFAILASTAARCWPQSAAPARLTIADGDAVLVRGATRTAAPLGLALKPGDIVETSKAAHLVRIEFADQTVLDLGPRTSVLLRPALTSRQAGSPVLAYALSGWIKVVAPANGQATAIAPALEVSTSGSVVMSVSPQDTFAFAEWGRATGSPRGEAVADRAAFTLDAGQFATASENDPPRLSAQPTAAWVRDVPAGFRDRVPRRIGDFANREVALPPGLPVTSADVEAWLRTEPLVRNALRPRWEALARLADARPPVPASLRPPPAAAPASRAATATTAGPPPSSPDARPAASESLEVATFNSPDRSAQGGLISPMAYAERDGDARHGSTAVHNGELLVKGEFTDAGQSAWGGVGVTVNFPGGALKAVGYKTLRIRLAASAGARSLRIRLLGIDRKLQRSGCYPIFEQAVTNRSRVYDIPLSRFVPEDYCGDSGASADSTLNDFFGIEIADAIRPVTARAVQFSIGAVSLLK